MRARFIQSFKIQAVEKALKRANDVSFKDISDDLRIGQSTLGKWIRFGQKQKLEPVQNTAVTHMIKAKRSQDWSAKARLDMVISCVSLDEEQISKLCREQELFPHHIKQWKQDFIDGSTATTTASIRSDNKTLRQDNKALKKKLTVKIKRWQKRLHY
jgi:transposase